MSDNYPLHRRRHLDMAETRAQYTDELHRVIDEVRGRVRVLFQWHGTFLALVVALLYVLGGVLLAQLFPQIGRLAGVYWAGLVILSGGSYWLFGVRPRSQYQNDEQVALLIQREIPELRDAPINSVQLEKQEPRGGSHFSPSLAEAYLRRAADQMQGISSRITVTDVPVFRSFGACMAAAVVFLGMLFLIPKTFHTGLDRLTGKVPKMAPEGSETADLRMVDLDVTYYYPDYLGRAPRTVQGDDGNLEAPAGTRVRLAGEIEPGLNAFHFVVNGEERRTVELKNDHKFTLEFSILEGGEYYLQDPRSSSRKTPARSISIVDDAKPDVRISTLFPQPGNDDVLDLEGGDVVRIRYRGSDDFGLNEIFLEYRYSGEVDTRTIRSFSRPRERASGTYEWVVPPEILKTTGKSSFRIGARDADNISGPKTAYSRRITIKSVTDEMQHARLLARQEKLLQHMVQLLGTELTLSSKRNVSSTRRRLKRNILQVLTLNRSVIEKMKDDPLADGGMYDELKEMRKRREEEAQKIFGDGASLMTRRWGRTVEMVEGMIPRMESDILRLDDLLQMDHMRAVRRMAEQLKQMQKSLREMLRKMRKGELSKEESARLKEKIAAMQRMMKRLQGQMAKTIRRLEQGFFNPDAMKKAEDREGVESALEKLKKMAETGEMEGAEAEARRLQKQIDQMLSSLEQTGKQLAKNRMGGRMKEMREINRGLQEAYRRQSEIANDTDESQQKMRGKAKKKMQKKFDQLIKRNIRRAREIEKQLGNLRKDLENMPGLQKYRKLRDRLRSTLDEMAGSRSESTSGSRTITMDAKTREKLQKIYREMKTIPGADAADRVGQDMPQALEDTKSLQNNLKKRRLKKSVERVSVLNRRMKTYERVLQNGRIAQEKVNRMKSSQQKGNRIEKDLKKLMEKLKQNMKKQASGSMKKKMKGLQKRQKRVGSKLEKLMEKMGKGMEGNIGKSAKKARGHMGKAAEELGGSEMSGARDQQDKALEALRKAEGKSGKAMQQMQKQMQGRRAAMPREEGRGGSARERVRIPKNVTSRSTDDFRQQIKRALKEGLPDLYRDSNQEYYEELTQ